ncbi:hypothetical protein D3C79_839010 [compost metagenome]
MGYAEINQAGFLTAGNDFYRMAENFFGAADEFAAVTRFTQGVGANDAHSAVGHAADQLGEALEAVQTALHRLFVELALFVDACGQLHLFPKPLKNADLGMVGLGHNHMEAVGAQVDGSNQGQILGCVLRHDHGFSVDNPAILPRSKADANAQLSKA